MRELKIQVTDDDFERVQRMQRLLQLTNERQLFSHSLGWLELMVKQHQMGKVILIADMEELSGHQVYPNWLARIPRCTPSDAADIVKELLDQLNDKK